MATVGMAMAPVAVGRAPMPGSSSRLQSSCCGPSRLAQCTESRSGLETSSFVASAASCSLSSARAFSGTSLRLFFGTCSQPVRVRAPHLMVRAGKPSMACTKRSRSRKSRARAQGFRVRMRTPGGRNVLRRRRRKGRKVLVTQSNPSSGKRA